MADSQTASGPKASVLIVDDEREHAQVMCEALERMGHRCDVTYSLDEAKSKLVKKDYDVIVTDLMMEGKPDGLAVLAESKEKIPAPPVVLVTAHADIPTCKRALSEGAYDYIEKPLDIDYFRAQVARAAEKAELAKQNTVLRAQLMEGGGFEGIVGRSASIQRVVATAKQVAVSDIPVLIMGESGTGKELIARAIHNNSRRRKNRLVALNCAGLAETILEDELFGHVRGAFTNAMSDREGRFEHADKGTLFLDEVGDMPGAMQAKLLRVLENGEVVRLGSNDPRKVDVRLISATNRDLEKMVAEKQFREDLFFRIKGVTITIPPLRERREDIPLLIHHFMNLTATKYNKEIEGISPDAQQKLMAYHWPGNVRQLRNVVENMVVLSPGKEITAEVLPPEVAPPAAKSSATGAVSGFDSLAGVPLDQIEKESILRTLRLNNGNRELTAKMLGIGERTLYRKIKEYGIEE